MIHRSIHACHALQDCLHGHAGSLRRLGSCCHWPVLRWHCCGPTVPRGVPSTSCLEDYPACECQPAVSSMGGSGSFPGLFANGTSLCVTHDLPSLMAINSFMVKIIFIGQGIAREDTVCSCQLQPTWNGKNARAQLNIHNRVVRSSNVEVS